MTQFELPRHSIGMISRKELLRIHNRKRVVKFYNQQPLQQLQKRNADSQHMYHVLRTETKWRKRSVGECHTPGSVRLLWEAATALSASWREGQIRKQQPTELTKQIQQHKRSKAKDDEKRKEEI